MTWSLRRYPVQCRFDSVKEPDVDVNGHVQTPDSRLERVVVQHCRQFDRVFARDNDFLIVVNHEVAVYKAVMIGKVTAIGHDLRILEGLVNSVRIAYCRYRNKFAFSQRDKRLYLCRIREIRYTRAVHLHAMTGMMINLRDGSVHHNMINRPKPPG